MKENVNFSPLHEFIQICKLMHIDLSWNTVYNCCYIALRKDTKS
jgi:hypothetical protein